MTLGPKPGGSSKELRTRLRGGDDIYYVKKSFLMFYEAPLTTFRTKNKNCVITQNSM